MTDRDGFTFGQQVKLPPLPAQQHFAYYAGMEINAPVPRLRNKSFRFTAQVDYKQGDSGVLFACGFNIGGYVFYVEDGKLCFHYNYVTSEFTDAVSSIPLPDGKHIFGFNLDFKAPGEAVGYVTIDGERAGDVVSFNDTAFNVKSCIGVGRYSSSPVKLAHKSYGNYFPYSGSYSRVDLHIASPETIEDYMAALKYHSDIE